VWSARNDNLEPEVFGLGRDAEDYTVEYTHSQTSLSISRIDFSD
jgi:hypothetical protein